MSVTMRGRRSLLYRFPSRGAPLIPGTPDVRFKTLGGILYSPDRVREGVFAVMASRHGQGCTTVVPAPAAALRRGRPPPPIACRGPALAPIASPSLKETLIPWPFRRPRPAGWSWRCVEDWSENRPRSGRHISGMIGDAWEDGGACSNRPAWMSTRWGPA